MSNQEKRKVILVTDGDVCARKAVEVATQNIGGRCISKSAGNPTPITSPEIVSYIKEAKHDPVVVMVDDRGNSHMGVGEQAMYEIIKHPDIDVIGIVAVASNTQGVTGVHVDFSIDGNGHVINHPVDKDGNIVKGDILYGDTVDVIEKCDVPIVVGIGDIGKMEGRDDCEIGAPIVTKALQEILNRSGVKGENRAKARRK